MLRGIDTIHDLCGALIREIITLQTRWGQKRKKPGKPGFLLRSVRLFQGANIRRLFTLGTGGHVEGNFLVFLECLETARLNCGKVRKQIVAAVIGGDKTKTLRFVKPFDGASDHIRVFPED